LKRWAFLSPLRQSRAVFAAWVSVLGHRAQEDAKETAKETEFVAKKTYHIAKETTQGAKETVYESRTLETPVPSQVHGLGQT
jgi:hypothetical protein